MTADVATSTQRYFHADSHVLEPTDWLRPYADPDIRERLRVLPLPMAPSNEDALARVAQRAGETVESPQWGRGYDAVGAWDAGERIELLDRFGIDAQLVFSTFAPGQFLSEDLDLLYGGVRAHTRALADFCSADPRLLPVPLIPFADVDRAMIELDAALELGCGGILVQTTAPSKAMGPSHLALDPFWARLLDADVAFVSHIGTGGRLVPTGYRENGRPLPTDFLGGGENIRSKDFINIGYWPENFLSALALDGVFERFPTARGSHRTGSRVGPRDAQEARRGHAVRPHRTRSRRAADADAGGGLHPPPGQVHALPQGRRRLGDRPGRPRPASVQHRLSPP